MEAVRQRLEDMKDIAIINPSPENVRAYVAEQEQAMERAQVFAEVWKTVLVTNPELDYSLKGRPTNNMGARVYDAARNADRDAVLRRTADTHGLFFYIKSGCVYCHALAPILKSFEMSYGFKVVAVTLDGGGLKEYPYPIPDNGSAARFNVSTTPALILVNPKTQQSQPVGYGMMSYEELRERIYMAVTYQPGARFTVQNFQGQL